MTVFEEQSKIFDVINNEISMGRLNHAFLVESNNYYQTDVFVKELCKKIMNTDDESVNFLIDNYKYPDIDFIYPDGNNIKKEQLLNVIKNYSETSMIGNKKIYVIEGADKLNDSSANTMLKFLEEPVDNVYAILVCNSRYDVIETIVSRCQILFLDSKYNEHREKVYRQEVYDFSKLMFCGEQMFLSYNDLLQLFSDRKEATLLLSEVELYLYDVYFGNVSNGFNLYRDTILSSIFVIEDALGRLNYNLNLKLFLDKFIIDIGGVV